MKKLLIIILLSSFVSSIYAQTVMGNTGLVNIPTADMQKDGTFLGGATFLPEGYLSNKDYNTGMYYVSFTPMRWIEATFRETLCRGWKIYHDENHEVVYEKRGYYQQDRSYSVRIAPLYWVKSAWCPQLVLGTNDPWSDNGGSNYSCAYGVLTKHINIKHIGDISASAGYYKPLGDRFGSEDTKVFNGAFGGLSFTPAFWDQMVLMADYDTRGVNIGMNVRFFNHWNIFVYERDFEKAGFGMTYQYTIDY